MSPFRDLFRSHFCVVCLFFGPTLFSHVGVERARVCFVTHSHHKNTCQEFLSHTLSVCIWESDLKQREKNPKSITDVAIVMVILVGNDNYFDDRLLVQLEQPQNSTTNLTKPSTNSHGGGGCKRCLRNAFCDQSKNNKKGASAE